MKKTATDKKTLILFAAVFMTVFVFSCCTPLLADDYNYSFSWWSGERVASVRDVVQSMILHWKNWHGRVIANGLASYFTAYPKIVFNTANAGAALILSLACYSFFRAAEEKHSFCGQLCAVLSVFSFTPAFGQVFLWQDGACNYSWAMASAAVFLLPYVLAYFEKSGHSSIYLSVLMAVQAFIAGAYSESCSIAAIFIALCILIFLLITKRRIPFRLYIDFGVCSCGFLWMMNAPSMKTGNRGTFSIGMIFSLIEKLTAKLAAVLEKIGVVGCVLLLLAICAFAAGVIVLRKNRKALFLTISAAAAAACIGFFVLADLPWINGHKDAQGLISLVSTDPMLCIMLISALFFALLLAAFYFKADRRVIVLSVIIFLGGFGSAFSFLFASYIPARGFSFYVFYLSIAIGLLLNSVIDNAESKFFVKAALSAVCVISVFFFGAAAVDNTSLRLQASGRNQVLREAQSSEPAVLYLEPYAFFSRYSGAYGLHELDPGFCNEMEKYYGLNCIESSK